MCSASACGARRVTTDELLERLYEKVGHDSNLSLTDHVAAGRIICRVLDRIVRCERPSSRGAIKLLACGSAIHRRFAVGDCGGMDAQGQTDDQLHQQNLDESRTLVRATATRLFVLLCSLSTESQIHRQELDESKRIVASVGSSSLWEMVRDLPKKRKKQKKDEASSYDTESADCEHDTDAWVVRTTSADVARHTLRIGASCLDDDSWTAIDGLMPLFFRHSVFNMAQSLLMPDGDQDYLSLSAADALKIPEEQREKKLLAIAQAGESEAGQQIVRDLLLSFLLPSVSVGVRRTLLLTRSASTQAGVDHPTLVSRSHDVAMAGTEWLWTNGTDDLERMCCLLAGVAVLTTKGDDDPIRKADAFGGRVQLPFFETKPPEPNALRLVLLPSARRWILFRLDRRGMPQVAASQAGFVGLQNAALQLVASLRIT